MPLQENQVAEVIKLLDEGMGSHEIAETLDVPFLSVVAIKAVQAKRKNQAAAEEVEGVDEAIEQKFGLEKDMQEALRANIGQLEAGLEIIDDGKEKKVASGFIDITAKDKQGVTVVIELKVGEADHKAIGQILSYMGDVMIDGTPVRGILVAGSFSTKAVSGAHAVPNIALKKYAFQFSFQAIT
jgi:RecB family endonuclease NucS